LEILHRHNGVHQIFDSVVAYLVSVWAFEPLVSKTLRQSECLILSRAGLTSPWAGKREKTPRISFSVASSLFRPRLSNKTVKVPWAISGKL